MRRRTEASLAVRWRVDTQWQLWPGDAAVGNGVVVTCERWTRLVVRRLADGMLLWDRTCAGRQRPVIIARDAVVVGVGDREVHSYTLQDGELRWRSADLEGFRLLRETSAVGPLALRQRTGGARTAPGLSSLLGLDGETGRVRWEQRLPGPLVVLPVGEVVLAGERPLMTWDGADGTKPSFVHHRDTELVALDAATGSTRRRWNLPSSVHAVVATSMTEVVAMCADGTSLRLSLTSGQTQRLPTTAATAIAWPTTAAGHVWGGAEVNGGLFVLDAGTLAVVAHPLPTHRIAMGVVPHEAGVLIGTQEAVVHHLDPLGRTLGHVHIGEKRLHALLPVPPRPDGEGPAALALTKSGLVAIDYPSAATGS